MRVSTSSQYLLMSQNLNDSLGRVQQHQTTLSSGRRINRFSDDAVGTAAAMRLRSQERDWGAYQRAAEDATSFIGTTDGALQTMSNLLRRAKELAISAVNGAGNAEVRAAIASEIGDIRSQLRDISNTQHLGVAVFGGFEPTAVQELAGPPPTWAFSGDSAQVKRQVSPTVTVAINLDGNELLGFAAGDSIFQVLSDLEAAAAAGNNPAIGAAQARLATRTDDIHIALGQLGAKANRIESASRLGLEIVNRLTEQRSMIEDVDLAEAVLKLQQATAGYEAALGAAGRANLPSLANFLR